MRRYSLHTRQNGVFYVELVTPEGRKLTSRSTGKTTEGEALLVVSEWLKNGVPIGRKRKPRPVDVAIGLDGILKTIRKADLNGDDGTCKKNCVNGYTARRNKVWLFQKQFLMKS
ncbi:MAG: hypothetical protein LBQ57_08805 [Spirochaetales bacterium]|jgi:hypothetical protein|nr:hypothetical protein [Spirochaetales bacterium]